MASNNNQEDLLLALMSMGFEYDNCRKVINDGVTELDEAVRRILNPEEPSSSRQQQDIHQPVLSLSSSSVTGTSATSESQSAVEETKVKSRYERQRREQEEYERQERMASELRVKKQKMEERQLKANILKEIASDHRKQTSSQAKTSTEDDKERKHREKEEFENKQREQWKKMERDKRMERQRVLAAIEADKESKKKEVNKEKSTKTKKSQPLTEHEKKVMCRIQVRYPDNTNETINLPSDSEFKELYLHCKTVRHDGTDTKYVLIQAYPRRTFTSADFTTTLKDLGMCPSCRLIYQIDIPVTNPSEVTASGEATSALPAHREDASMQEQPDSLNENTEEMTVDDTREEEVWFEEEPIEPVIKQPCLGSRLLQGQIDNEIDDDFLRTINERHSHSDDENAVNPNLIEEAIKRRLANKTEEEEDVTTSRKLNSLQKAAAIYIAKQLLKKQPDIVHHVGLLNPTAADFIVKALQRSNNLSSELLKILQPCKLKEMNFDLWRLAPHDLVDSLKTHHNLRKLSLKSVRCVSDRLIETIIKTARRISYLNLSDCENVVGSFLTSSQGLTRLKTLILSRTKTKDEYIRNFLRLEVAELNELNLSKCPITNEAFDLEKDYPSMRVLSIDETQVDSLSFLKCFSNICFLSVRKTNISNKDMEFVARLQNLYALELQSTKISYEGLLYIRDKKLYRFSLPDRLCVDNQCINVIQGFNLEVLDLNNFVNLDDGCISSICRIKSLKHLYLSKILKLTDAGILQLKDLHHLETLNLRNTNVTSNIAPLFKSLPQLHTLDLTGTRIDNTLIPHLSNSCDNLFKLNMSHTEIDDEGIIFLRLPRLDVLTLDDTEVTSESLTRLRAQCEMLSRIRNASKNFLYESSESC